MEWPIYDFEYIKYAHTWFVNVWPEFVFIYVQMCNKQWAVTSGQLFFGPYTVRVVGHAVIMGAVHIYWMRKRSKLIRMQPLAVLRRNYVFFQWINKIKNLASGIRQWCVSDVPSGYDCIVFSRVLTPLFSEGTPPFWVPLSFWSKFKKLPLPLLFLRAIQIGACKL